MPILLRRLMVVGVAIAAFAPDLTRAQSQITMPGYPAPGAPPTITVSVPGSEPRTRLRYKVRAGQTFLMEMATTIGMNISVEGMAMPAMDMPIMKMTMSMSVKDVAANGDITYDAAFTEMTAEGLPGMDPSLVAMVQGAAQQVKALKGTVVISDRGIVRSGNLDVEDAVGVGAKWEVRQALNSAGMQMFQRVDVELASADASSATMRVKVDQNTPPQSVNNPALPAGATIELEKMVASGSGTITQRFDTLVPMSEISTTSNGAMTMNMGGMSQKMATDTKIKITVGPKKQ
jgi:hypothetical protein